MKDVYIDTTSGIVGHINIVTTSKYIVPYYTFDFEKFLEFAIKQRGYKFVITINVLIQ